MSRQGHSKVRGLSDQKDRITISWRGRNGVWKPKASFSAPSLPAFTAWDSQRPGTRHLLSRDSLVKRSRGGLGSGRSSHVPSSHCPGTGPDSTAGRTPSPAPGNPGMQLHPEPVPMPIPRAVMDLRGWWSWGKSKPPGPLLSKESKPWPHFQMCEKDWDLEKILKLQCVFSRNNSFKGKERKSSKQSLLLKCLISPMYRTEPRNPAL